MMRFILCLLLMSNTLAFADDANVSSREEIRAEWVQAYYKTPEKDQANALKPLIERAHSYTVASNRSTEALVLEATINACYAKSLKSLSGLKYAEEAKKLMLEAEKQAKTPLQAVNIYRTLGTLYYKIPSWPIGFGDKKIAKAYLDKALALDPNSMDVNYIYADFLSEQKAYANAVHYYKRAQLGLPSPEGADADKVRLKEVEIGLRDAEAQLIKLR